MFFANQAQTHDSISLPEYAIIRETCPYLWLTPNVSFLSVRDLAVLFVYNVFNSASYVKHRRWGERKNGE